MTDRRPLATLALALLLSSGASARDISQNEVLELRRRGELLPFEQVIALVETRHPGAQILEAELEEDDGRYLYERDIITRGNRVRELELDARDARSLDEELEVGCAACWWRTIFPCWTNCCRASRPKAMPATGWWTAGTPPAPLRMSTTTPPFST